MAATHRLAYGEIDEHRDHEPRDAEHQERGEQAETRGDGAGESRAKPGAKQCAKGEHGHRHRPVACRELVGNHRSGWWRPAGFADADAESSQYELQHAVRRAAKRNHGRPQRERERDDVAAVGAVRQHCDRHPDADVEQCERGAADQGDAGVGEPQLEPDRLEQRRDDEAIGNVQRVDDRQHRQRVPAPGACTRPVTCTSRGRRCHLRSAPARRRRW